MNWRRLIPNSISSASLIFGVLSIFKTRFHRNRCTF